MTSLGGVVLRPSTTADGGTSGELVAPNNVEVTAVLPIAKASRKKRDLVLVGVFMKTDFLRLQGGAL